MRNHAALLPLVLLILMVGCGSPDPAPSEPALARTPAPATQSAIRAPTEESTTQGTDAAAGRVTLSLEDLLHGFDGASPVELAAVTIPNGALLPEHTFEGRLELLGEDASGQILVLRGDPDIDLAMGHLPEFDYQFVQSGGYLVPVQRGLIITAHPIWNYIIEPGRVWQEGDDTGYSRASFPFALVVKGGNATLNGVMTFLFDEQHISKVWYQISQETTISFSADLWGLLDAVYHPSPVTGAEQVRSAFARELVDRLPTKPIQELARDYPGVDLAAFGQDVSPDYMTWYGFAYDGVNYVGGCQTRHGPYPYCEYMRASSYSVAKSAFVSVALMRLAQKHDPNVPDFLIRDYVPEAAASPGDWSNVTFDHVLDMASGNFRSAGFMEDEEHFDSDPFWLVDDYAGKIKAAFDAPHSAEPGTRWVYRTSDTFIVTRAMHNYLQTVEGPDVDLFQFVVDEIYKPLKIGPGGYTVLRTRDNNWQGQAIGGLGLWLVPDDVAKIASLLNADGGVIDGEQILNPDLLGTALQLDSGNRGVDIDTRRKYNNAFWAQKYGVADGFDCEFWVPHMLGYSGVVVALFPNGATYYYASDNREFSWAAALREADKVAPLCRTE